MLAPDFAHSFRTLLLIAADDGRRDALFGDSFERAWEAVPPFLVGRRFPDVYLEHPLAGDPFLDVTVLLQDVEPRTRIDSPAAGEHAALLDWYASIDRAGGSVNLGFELDTSVHSLPEAAVHFQPRAHLEYVRPFCEAAGEPGRADLYLDLAARMPRAWPLSFFGMFRGRPASPLRVCGYLSLEEKLACAADAARLAATFDRIGFSAYDGAMLAQITSLLTVAPPSVDFQFDVYPDGGIGDTFAIDASFGVERPSAVLESFSSGVGARTMGLLESWGAADARWRDAARAAFARAIDVEGADGAPGRLALTVMPQWVKVRWRAGELQAAKLYHSAGATLFSPRS